MKQPIRFRKPKRFNGQTLEKYSPRGLLLFLLPIGLIPAVVIAIVKGHIWNTLINAAGFALYMLAAWCLRKGLTAERAFGRDRFSVRPKLRLKMMAAVLMAIATGFVAWLGAQQPIGLSVVLGAGAFLGMYLSYGFDPNYAITIASAQGYSGREIHQALEESAQKIGKIKKANDAIGNSELNQRIERICQIASDILADIESDPKDFRRARKFLNVYLDGAQKVTEGYAKTHSQTQTGALEKNFRDVLQTIETVFQEQQQTLLEEDVFDLDVKIEVLNKQLKSDGIL